MKFSWVLWALSMMGLTSCSNSDKEKVEADARRSAEPEAPPEPEYDEVYDIVLADGTKDTCEKLDSNGGSTCFLAEDCTSGFIYPCLITFKYKPRKILRKSE